MDKAKQTQFPLQTEASRLHRALSEGAAAIREKAGYVNLRVQALEAAKPKLTDESRKAPAPDLATMMMEDLITQVDEALTDWSGFAKMHPGEQRPLKRICETEKGHKDKDEFWPRHVGRTHWLS
ncbi:hypothetical protein ACHAQH_001937 [Verticillium albo-atrum]